MYELLKKQNSILLKEEIRQKHSKIKTLGCEKSSFDYAKEAFFDVNKKLPALQAALNSGNKKMVQELCASFSSHFDLINLLSNHYL